MISHLHIFLLAALCGSLLAGSAAAQQDRETAMQVSTIDSLLSGNYDGEMSLEEMLTHGDFGIGTFDRLDGEMLVLGGVVYQIAADGVARVMPPETTTPFATVTFFEADQRVDLKPGMTLPAWKEATDKLLPTPNLFYAIKIEGMFRTMKTRSVPRQSKPYGNLRQIADSQPTFDFEDVEGTLVGFRCPGYVGGINVPGYHLHFLTEDKRAGGHVLEFTVEHAEMTIDHTPNFLLKLPGSKEFYATDLEKDQSEDLRAVEQ